MRKKFLKVMSVVLTAALTSAALTGCGTQAKATDQEVLMEEEPIIVTDEENSDEEAIIDTEDEITEEEVIGDDKNDGDKEASVTEHEYFFALDEQDPSTAEEIDWDVLRPDGNEYELLKSVTLYGSGKGRIAGYTKENIHVNVVTSGEDWYCIEFKDEDPEYQLLLIKAEDFIVASGMYENMPAVTTEDVKLALINQLYDADYGVDEVYFVALDHVIEEMDLAVEFTVPTYCRDLDVAIVPIVVDNDFGNYKYFYFEKVEEKSNEENSCFKVTYGALQEFAE